jgi:glyoxylase-like metal-dependent hydrolase (beta-lactamase superfamily II)
MKFHGPRRSNRANGISRHEFEKSQTVEWTPEDVDLIIHTHLHNDRVGDCLCSNNGYACRAELEFLITPSVDPGIIDILDGVNVVPIEGDAEIVEGIDVLLPRHTLRQSVVQASAKLSSRDYVAMPNFPRWRGHRAGCPSQPDPGIQSMKRLASATSSSPYDLEIGRRRFG